MGLTATYRYSSDVAHLQNYPKFMRNETEMDLGRAFKMMKPLDPELRAEPYYTQRSLSSAGWVVMRGPTIAEGVAAELTNSALPSPKAVRGGLTHDRARAWVRDLNRKHAQKQQ